MDLSKAFDCLPHELIIAKLAAYGLGKGALQVIFSYLKNRKQSVKVKRHTKSSQTNFIRRPTRVVAWPYSF